MAGFVEVTVTTSAAELVQLGLERLKSEMELKGYVGWEPQPSDVITIATEALGPLAADAMAIFAEPSAAIFRRFGTKLENLPYNQGAEARGMTLWTLEKTATGELPQRTIPAGFQVLAARLGFYVPTEVVIPPGQETAVVEIRAIESGARYNFVSGVCEPAEALNWVKEITLTGETSGGTEAETDEEYENRLQQWLTLQAARPITASDFAVFARDVPQELFPSGQVVGRSTAIDGYNPTVTSFTGTVTEHSNAITAVSSFAGITAGSVPSQLEGAGIPIGAVVTELHVSENKITMSVEATATHTAEAINAIGSGENRRCVTVFVTNKQGRPLSPQAMTTLETIYAEHRELNFLTFVRAPSYTPVYATIKVHILPGFEATTVCKTVEEAVKVWLSPEKWGNPTATEAGSLAWLSRISGYNVIRWNSIVGVCEGVRGVAYVFPGTEGLKLGRTASPTEAADLAMYGPAPLPEPMTITVTSG